MIKNKINFHNKKGVIAITAAATTIMLVVSIATIGAAPFSNQQQGPEQRGPTITSGNIEDETIVSADLRDEAAVRSSDIVDGQIATDDLADDAVTSDKIRDGEVTSDDVADGTITSTDIAEGTIPPPAGGGTPDDNSVTSAKIVDGEVKSADIGDGEVTTQDLADGAVTRSKMASDAIMPYVHEVVGLPPTRVTSLSTGTATADCPDGEIVIGGGFDSVFSSSFNDLEIIKSRPLDENTWSVVARSEVIGPLATDEFIWAIAMCMGPSPP
jgi:hypothetical protein